MGQTDLEVLTDIAMSADRTEQKDALLSMFELMALDREFVNCKYFEPVEQFINVCVLADCHID